MTFTKYEDGCAYLHVVAAAVVDARGRVLIAERPKHKSHGGLWEFPGGKREAGESSLAALRREFREEIGIDLTRGRPLIRVPFHYPGRSLILDVWRVDGFAGVAEPREGQRLAWVAPERLVDFEFPEANRPVVRALNLPQMLLTAHIKPDEAESTFESLGHAIRAGVRCVQLAPTNDGASAETRHGRTRLLSASGYRRLREVCRDTGARLMVSGSVGDALALGADGVHFEAVPLRHLESAQIPSGLLASASCDSPMGLAHAARHGLDYAVLGSSLGRHAFAVEGWHRVRQWVRRAGLPVFAHGALDAVQLRRAVDCGCQGLAVSDGMRRPGIPDTSVPAHRVEGGMSQRSDSTEWSGSGTAPWLNIAPDHAHLEAALRRPLA